MADVLAIPAEFDTILVAHISPGTNHAYGKTRPVTRPPVGPFTHHAVLTFAKACSEGRVGLNWRQHLVCAQQTWENLNEKDHSALRQAAERDKKRYDEQVKERAAGGSKEPLLDEKLADTGLSPKKKVGGDANEALLEEKLPHTGIAPSAFDLFKDSPVVRSRLYEAKHGPIGYHEFYADKVFRWLWGRVEEDEKTQWREEANRRLDITNEHRRNKGEKELVNDTEPGPPENPAPKRKRLDAVVKPKEPEVIAGNDEQVVSKLDAEDDEEESEGVIEVKQVESQEFAEDEQNESKEVAEDESEAEKTGDSPLDLLPWTPTEDENLSKEEKKLLESKPLSLRRWDRPPRTGRSAYTLFYADRFTAGHIGENPHSSATRVKIHAEWEATDDETKQHFEALARADEEQCQRQSEEYNEWQKGWHDLKGRILLHKVIDRWHPQTSFDEGQNRVRTEVPRLGPKSLHPDYGLYPLYYPVIRTDYSNDAVYKQLQYVLLNSEFDGDATSIEMTFYDGMEPVSLKNQDIPDPWPGYAKEDPRASDREWCQTHFENKSIDDLKTSFGELNFYRKEHIPVYSFGGQCYALVIDSQSMKDGTVVLLSLNHYDLVDTRPDDDRGPDGAWKQDRNKQWYLAPRVQAGDVVIELVNLDITNVAWLEVVLYRKEDGLDLVSDPKSQQWRGWQWAIEYIFGGQALEHVVGKLRNLPSESYLPHEQEQTLQRYIAR